MSWAYETAFHAVRGMHLQTTRRAIDGVGEEENGAEMPETIARLDGSTTRYGTLSGA